MPTLLLDDGEVLVESMAILDHLDALVGPDRALIACEGKERRTVLRLCALATGLCDKMVSLVYERLLHETVSPAWIERCEIQVAAVLDVLEAEHGARASRFWLGERMTHADIALTCAMRFLREAHRDRFDPGRWLSLVAHADRCEELEAFRAVVQPFVPPASMPAP